MERANPRAGAGRFASATLRQRAWGLVCLLLGVVAAYGGPVGSETTDAATAARRLQYWHALIQAGKNTTEPERLAAVNDFFNGASFVDDRELWQTADYWATPEEFLTRDAGDCEDFAIAKYFTLKAMGVAPEKLRITYVKVSWLSQAHMVLAYYETPQSEPLILDNLNRRIEAAGERPDLRPVYSFNAENLWLARSRHDQKQAGRPGQLQRWREMLARLSPGLRQAVAAPEALP